jgi:cell division protein FtsI/penicillin-binding protein 2
MVAVVQRGTGTTAQLPGVTVAGKTGTATNPLGAAHSWFVCFAPADNPRIVVAIVVENAGYGATVAAPIAREVLRTALKSSS